MTSKHFDPRKFIDREFEQELFEDLLQFKNDARILAIRDKGGMGKSHLLEKFQYRCRVAKPRRIPISLIELDQLSDSSPLTLIKLIVQHLASFEVACPTFTRYDSARVSADFKSIRASAYLQGTITMQMGAAGRKQSAREQVNSTALRLILVEHFNAGELRDLCFDLSIDYEAVPGQTKSDKARELVDYARRHRRVNELVEHCRRLRPQADWQDVDRSAALEATHKMDFTAPFDELDSWDDEPFAVRRDAMMEPLTSEQQMTAQDVCIRAFFDDLSTICADRLIVLMFDAYEKCAAKLKQWIEEQFLERLLFNIERRPHGLILVVSGRELPDFDARWSIEDCDTLVRSVKELGKWKRDDVAECLRVHGYDNYEDQDVDAFHRLILMGIAPSEVIGLIQSAVANRRRS